MEILVLEPETAELMREWNLRVAGLDLIDVIKDERNLAKLKELALPGESLNQVIRRLITSPPTIN